MRGFLMNYLSILLVMLVALYGIMPLSAQNKGVYDGNLQIVNYKGKATYEFEIIGKDTVLSGAFKVQSSNLEALLTKADTTFLIDGAFDAGKPTGFWKFQFGIFKADAKSSVVDYQYRILASGLQEEAKGLFINGKPNGPWQYIVNEIQQADVRKTLFKSSVIFENGIPQRNFRIEGDSTILVGRFLRDGYAHDEWELYNSYDTDATEKWRFNDGVLESIVTTVNGKEQGIVINRNREKPTKTINLDLNYLKVLSLILPQKNQRNLMGGGMAELLGQNASYYQKIDTLFSVLGSSRFKPNFNVRLPHFPIDSVDLKYLEAIKTDVNLSRSIKDSYLNNTLLNILKLSDAEAQNLYLALEMLTTDYLEPLERLSAYEEQGFLEFIPIKQRVEILWPKGMNESLIIEKATQLPYTDSGLLSSLTFDMENNTMMAMANLARYTAEQLVYIRTLLSEKLSNEERQQELVALEEELLFENKNLSQSIDSLGATLPVNIEKALAEIKRFMDSELNDYSNQEELKKARELVQCYKQMNLLVSEVALFPSRTIEIDSLYKDRIWNPFMASLMDEEVKKRIVNAYKKILVPHFLSQIQSGLSCENTSALLVRLKSTYERMLALREEDTKKIERKLRKEEVVQVIMELLDIGQKANTSKE